MGNKQDDCSAGETTALRAADPEPAAVSLFRRNDTKSRSTVGIEVEETVTDVVRRHAQVQPGAPALVAEGRESLTYGALVRQMDEIQRRLNAMGYGRGDRIAIVAPNGPMLATLVTGIMGCAVAVPMNPVLSVGEFVIYLRDQKVRAVALDAGMDSPVRAAAEQIGLPVLEVDAATAGPAGLFDIRHGAAAKPAARPGPAGPGDLALVLLTSGTTSHSKVVPITHSQLATKARRMVRFFEMTAADRCLNLMPLFHGHGLHTALGGSLYCGGSLVTLPEFSVGAFFRLISTLGPTWYTGSYTFHHAIYAAAPQHSGECAQSRLRFIRTASGHLDNRIAEQLEKVLRAPVIETYSSTEMSVICSSPLPPGTRKKGTVGIAVGGEVAIMDPDNRLLPPGERGEVVVRSTEVFTGYENDPAANAESFVDGWFRTGDEGVFDDEGYLTLTGRIKDIINRGGEKITPSEVDGALKDHPDVADAVTFPIPHATLGQEVAAAVVPEQGADLTDEILTHFLRRRLAPFKIPRRFVIVDEIPKGPTGKVSRQGLADQLGLVTDSATARPERIEDDRPASALEAKLQRLWAEVLGLDRVGLHEDFFMLGGDSLQAVELFLRVEKELGRRLPRSVLFEAGTVAKMAERIEAEVPSSCIVPIQTKGKHPPFFCVHDGNGQVLNYRDLSRFLGDVQPFYGIQCRGLDGEEEPFTRIEEMAEYYVREIKKLQPEGPYYIGGYSFGGRVAYVMAQHMRAAGDDVALLALFDTYSAYGQQMVRTRDWFTHHLQRIKTVPPARLPAYLWLRVQNLAKMIYMRLRLKSYSTAWRFYRSQGKPLPRILRRPVPANDMIRRSYRPQPYDGNATLFKAELYAWTHPIQHEGWKKLIRGKLDIRPVPGQHYEIMNQPHVRTVAAELADALDKARTAHAQQNTRRRAR
jgi:acyl-CoA synthetase (AMP-forming)/AMP-acid ligase II/thioesterase domain-containing protein/acyl carrier protein